MNTAVEKKVLVLGIGNSLLTDEGIGVHVVRELLKERIPPDVTVFEGGVSGIDLLSLIEEHDKLIVIDAVNAGAPPGAVFRFKPEQVDNLLRNHKTSLHQLDLFDTIKIARLLDKSPETVIIGVQPKEIFWGLSLTRELSEKLPEIVALVKDEIAAMLSLCLKEGSELNGN